MSLSLNPQKITENLWYYEENRGILIVHEIRVPKFEMRGTSDTNTETKYLRTDQILIPWRKIRASTKRRERQVAAWNRRKA